MEKREQKKIDTSDDNIMIFWDDKRLKEYFNRDTFDKRSRKRTKRKSRCAGTKHYFSEP